MNRFKFFTGFVTLLVGSICLVEASFPVSFAHYKEPADALTVLRKFAPAESLQDRCTRDIALLINWQNKQDLETRQIAAIAQDSIGNLAKQAKNVPSTQISKLLFSGLDSYINNANLDKAYLDLIDCVRFTFQGSSIQVLRELSNEQYTKPAQQLTDILSQSANLLADPLFKHPNLKLDDLEPSVRRTVLSWFQNDESKLQAHFVNQREHGIDVLSSKLDEVFDALSDAYRQIDDRWEAENKCHVYTDFIKFGLGASDRREAELTLKNLATKIELVQKIPKWNPSSSETDAIIDFVRSAVGSKSYHPILLEVVDCLATVFSQNQPKAASFMESEELDRLLSEMESAFQSQVPAAEIETSEFATAAEPDEESDSDYEDDDEDSDDDDSDDDEEEEGEEGEDDEEEEEEDDEEEDGQAEKKQGNDQEEEEEDDDDEVEDIVAKVAYESPDTKPTPQ